MLTRRGHRVFFLGTGEHMCGDLVRGWVLILALLSEPTSAVQHGYGLKLINFDFSSSGLICARLTLTELVSAAAVHDYRGPYALLDVLLCRYFINPVEWCTVFGISRADHYAALVTALRTPKYSL